MLRVAAVALISIKVLSTVACSVAQQVAMRLVYHKRIDIKSGSQGLTEPSGLALSADGKSLWVVSDDTRKIFRLDLDGELDRAASFKIEEKGLEGIAADPGGRFLFAVKEERNEILKVDLHTQRTVLRRRLQDLRGYPAIASAMGGGGSNKGIEGVAWNSKRGSLFVLKEGRPGMLVEIDSGLTEVLGHRLLGEGNGFTHPKLDEDDLDFSGLVADDSSDTLLIVSDQGECLYRFDNEVNEVVGRVPLTYERKGKRKTIKKAEGVALDWRRNRLYVVSDKEARLYVFDLEE